MIIRDNKNTNISTQAWVFSLLSWLMQDRIIFHYISCTGINRQTRRQSDLGEAHIWRVDGHPSCHADHIQLLRSVGTFFHRETERSVRTASYLHRWKKMSQTSTEKSSRSGTHNVRVDLKPDGGYGWIVCCGTFMVNFVVFGIHNSFGVVYVNLLDDLKLGEIQTGKVLN